MELKLALFQQSATNLIDSEPVQTEVANQAHAASHAASGVIEPLTVIIWIVAIIAVAAVWYAHTEKPYVPSRFRRPVGVGPLTHLRNTIINRFYSFLP